VCPGSSHVCSPSSKPTNPPRQDPRPHPPCSHGATLSYKELVCRQWRGCLMGVMGKPRHRPWSKPGFYPGPAPAHSLARTPLLPLLRATRQLPWRVTAEKAIRDPLSTNSAFDPGEIHLSASPYKAGLATHASIPQGCAQDLSNKRNYFNQRLLIKIPFLKDSRVK